MNAFTALCHNGRLLDQAENIINNFLASETENHMVACFIENPDGTRVAIQKGFKLLNYEYFSTNCKPKDEWTIEKL